MKDLFTDILVRPDNSLLAVLDLDDLAQAQELGLVSPTQVNDILRKTQLSIQRINYGEFPFPEIIQGQQACRELGWRA
jgi:predicted RNA-binding protein associated with RNAse of E/G family